jgi:lipopolysaccharide transport system ATP-binding protein
VSVVEPAIRVVGLSKRFRIGARDEAYRTLRESLMRAISAPFRRHAPTEAELVWALRDVSFDVAPGEVLGVIGRNGAGKSTLLKVLSRITPPTHGHAEIRGRVGALLEVGTGFHPELTGRENVYLSGAILGMRRREIARRFDEIVAFAEVDRYIDTPIKHYSSGMHLRLAFAVAAHLEPEVLLVDEVLAVGDAAFQRKCLGRMRDEAMRGRTVLFVSHSMAAVTQLCSRAIWLDGGRIRLDGSPQDVVQSYLAEGAELQSERRWPDVAKAPGDERVRFIGARLLQNDDVAPIVDINRELRIVIEFQTMQRLTDPVAAAHFSNAEGTCLFATADWRGDALEPGRYQQTLTIPPRTFAEGRVAVLLQFFPHPPTVLVPDALSFTAIDSDVPDVVRGTYKGAWPGVVRLGLEWSRPAPLNGIQ